MEPFKKYLLYFWMILDPYFSRVILCYFSTLLLAKYELNSNTPPPLYSPKFNIKRMLLKTWLGIGE